ERGPRRAREAMTRIRDRRCREEHLRDDRVRHEKPRLADPRDELPPHRGEPHVRRTEEESRTADEKLGHHAWAIGPTAPTNKPCGSLRTQIRALDQLQDDVDRVEVGREAL